jgi:hypothetical protein
VPALIVLILSPPFSHAREGSTEAVRIISQFRHFVVDLFDFPEVGKSMTGNCPCHRSPHFGHEAGFRLAKSASPAVRKPLTIHCHNLRCRRGST